MNLSNETDPGVVKFSLGGVVATPGALSALQQFNIKPVQLFARHCGGDWGELDPEDVNANEQALKHGGRLMSCYTLGGACKIWIITEADRSSSCLLLPEEY